MADASYSSDRRNAALRLGLLALAIAVAAVLVALFVSHSPSRVRGFVDGLGAAGPVAFVVLGTVLACAFFPFPAIGAASGLLFGTLAGSAISLTTAVTGGVLAFLISRVGAADPARALAGRRIRRAMEAVDRRGFVAVLELRIIPGAPRGAVDYACGLTRVSLGSYAAATALGTAPRAYAYTALGGSLGNLRSTQSIVALSLLVAIGVVGAVILLRELRAARNR
ncbi:MAG: hypothetical protein NVS2B9_20860 [Myxococcales bacterium]